MMHHNVSQAGCVGAAATVALSVSGIKTSDVLLAVWKWADAGGNPAAVAVSDFTVADGTITAATLSTASARCWVIWFTPHG